MRIGTQATFFLRAHTTFPPYNVTRKFHVVVVQNNGKEMYTKSALRVQSCIFAN